MTQKVKTADTITTIVDYRNLIDTLRKNEKTINESAYNAFLTGTMDAYEPTSYAENIFKHLDFFLKTINESPEIVKEPDFDQIQRDFDNIMLYNLSPIDYIYLVAIFKNKITEAKNMI